MNYYYDLILNLNDENILFYEWEENDNLEYIEKIPVYKINETDMLKILQNKIKVSEEFINLIKNKTILKESGIINTISYATIFTDTKTTIALEFDKSGKEIARSNLLLEDDLNVCEIGFTIKKKMLKYEVIENIRVKHHLRKVIKIKDYIKKEITKLYQDKNKVKLSFLFLEWFNKNEDNIEKIYNLMLKELESEFDDNQFKIYEIIKLSYNKI